MQNLRPSNIKVIFQRPSCGSPRAVAGFIAVTAAVLRSIGKQCGVESVVEKTRNAVVTAATNTS